MTVGDLIARIGFKLDPSGLNQAEARVKGFSTRSSSNMLAIGAAMKTAFAGAGAAMALRFAKQALEAFDKQAAAVAQVRQGLLSTQAVSGKALDGLLRDASALQKTTLFGDEDILQNVTAQLLTFTNISGTAFDRTQKAALDLATRLGGDLKGAAIQLGKALNDPVANLSALSRSGIQFSKDQKDLIKSLADTNQLAKAQAIILDELETQYGGAAEAAARAGTGPIKQLGNELGDMTEKIGALIAVGLIPVIQQFRSLVQIGGVLLGQIKQVDGAITVFTQTFLGLTPKVTNLKRGVKDTALEFTDFSGSAVQLGLNLEKLPPPLEKTATTTTKAGKAASEAVNPFKALREEVHAMAVAAGKSLVPVIGETNDEIEDIVITLPVFIKQIEDAENAAKGLGIELRQTTLPVLADLRTGFEKFRDGLGDSLFLAADFVRDFTGTAQSLLASTGPWGMALAGGLELAKAFGLDLNKILADAFSGIHFDFSNTGPSAGFQNFVADINRMLAEMARFGEAAQISGLIGAYQVWNETLDENDPRMQWLIELMRSFGIEVDNTNEALGETLIHFETLPPLIEEISGATAVFIETISTIAGTVVEGIQVLEDFDDAVKDHFIDTFNEIDDTILKDFHDAIEDLGLVLMVTGDEADYYADAIRAAEEAQRALLDAVTDGTLSVDEATAAFEFLEAQIERFRALAEEPLPAPTQETGGGGGGGGGVPTGDGAGTGTIETPRGEVIGRINVRIDRESLNGLQVGLVRPWSDWLLDLRNFAAIAGGFDPITAPIYSPNRWTTGAPGGQTLRIVDHNFQEILTGTIGGTL